MEFVMWKQWIAFQKPLKIVHLQTGDKAPIKFGEGLAWATLVTP